MLCSVVSLIISLALKSPYGKRSIKYVLYCIVSLSEFPAKKIRTMSQSQDKEETKPIVSPDETAHTGFGEMFTQATIEQQELTLEKRQGL